jgi:predicted nuclease of predicted toxin-antitoxin system
MVKPAAIYLDENIEVALAVLLATEGIDALTARDVGMLGASDEEHLLKAVELDRAILTHDTQDFEVIAIRWAAEGRVHNGIVLCTIPSPSEVRDALTFAMRLYPDLTNLTLRIPLAG